MSRILLTACCLALSLVPLAVWAHAAHRSESLDANGPRRVILCWEGTGGGRVMFAWMRPDGNWPRYAPLFTSYPLPAPPLRVLAVSHQLGPFGCDLGRWSGAVVFPLWSVSLVFLAWPMWRAYRWWKPRKARAMKGAFEPVLS